MTEEEVVFQPHVASIESQLLLRTIKELVSLTLQVAQDTFKNARSKMAALAMESSRAQ
jgi:hypothetical protein